jgi:hypothetical protein
MPLKCVRSTSSVRIEGRPPDLQKHVADSLDRLRTEQTERYEDFVVRHDRLIREPRLILYALFGIALWVGMHWYGWLKR